MKNNYAIIGMVIIVCTYLITNTYKSNNSEEVESQKVPKKQYLVIPKEELDNPDVVYKKIKEEFPGRFHRSNWLTSYKDNNGNLVIMWVD